MVSMQVNTVEADFLRQIREAPAKDIKTVIDYLHKLKEREDRKGKGLTPISNIVGALCEELTLNGLVKWKNIEEA